MVHFLTSVVSQCVKSSVLKLLMIRVFKCKAGFIRGDIVTTMKAQGDCCVIRKGLLCDVTLKWDRFYFKRHRRDVLRQRAVDIG